MAAYLDAAIASALKKAGKDENFRLKAEQRAIIEAVVCSKKDVLGVLPTGFGKSLVFHLLSDVFDFVDAKGPPTKTKAITIVVSPLNALMRDQIGKLDHLGAIILDGAKRTNHLATSLATDGKTATDIFTPRTSSREQYKSDAENNQLSEKCTLHCSR